MKYIAHICLLLVGVGAAFLRWIDLVNFTDIETGFVTAGSVWLRYGAMLLLVVMAFAASFMASRRPKGLESTNPALGVATLLLAMLCAAQNAVAAVAALALPSEEGTSILRHMQTISWLSLGIALLGVLCAVWLFSVAFSLFGSSYHLPAGGACLGIIGNIYFYAQLILAFANNQSSYHHLTPTLSVFAAATALWFATMLLRAIYYPESKIGRKLYLGAMVCFYICVGFALPQVAYDFMIMQGSISDITQQILYAAFGVWGASYAACALSEDLA